MGARDHLLDRAVHQQDAVGDVRNLMTALGLVHVVGRDQHGQAFGRERMDLVPELAPRLGVDAGGRLVEQQKLRVGQRAGAEREPLLPAARQFAGKLLLAALEAEPLDHRARRRRRLGKSVKPGDEFEIFAHRQILIEAEALCHVTDMALDFVGFGADVETEAGALPLVRREQPGEHADGGGLAGAVGTEKSVDGAALYLHGQIAHHGAAAEGFRQAVDIDGDFMTVGHGFGPSVTLTGCPTRSLLGRVGARLDQKDELRALLQAVDHRRREFRRARDEGDLGRDVAATAVAMNVDRVAEAELRQHGLVDEEAHFEIPRRQHRDHRLAGRHHFADAEIDLLDRAGDRAEHLAARQSRLGRVEPGLRGAQRRFGIVESLLGTDLGLHQRHCTVVGKLRVLHRGLLHGDVGKLQIGVQREQRRPQFHHVAFPHRQASRCVRPRRDRRRSCRPRSSPETPALCCCRIQPEGVPATNRAATATRRLIISPSYRRTEDRGGRASVPAHQAAQSARTSRSTRRRPGPARSGAAESGQARRCRVRRFRPRG